MTNLHTQIWDEAFPTDPKHTKKFERGGGFKGTAIKPFYIVHRLTEMFGPCGKGWGFEETANQYIAGVWCSYVRFWYKLDGHEYDIYQWGQTTMEGANKHGPFVDEEAPKKAITDGFIKCASMLGFGGDVHMGQFDDSKYVTERNKQETAKARNDRFKAIKQAIEQSTDPAETWGEHIEEILEFKESDQQFYDDLVAAGAKRKKDLESLEADKASFGQGFPSRPLGEAA